ncbi:MAG TPA: hypothetical protein VJR27_01655 [Candidatus Saccharimonadales bacterium]|nr:hypothetical protein [Candidatus Saccharimonadales bacterium]
MGVRLPEGCNPQDGLAWANRINENNPRLMGERMLHDVTTQGFAITVATPEQAGMLKNLHDTAQQFSELPREIQDQAAEANQGWHGWGMATSAPGIPDLGGSYRESSKLEVSPDAHPAVYGLWRACQKVRGIFTDGANVFYDALGRKYNAPAPFKTHNDSQVNLYYMPDEVELERFNQKYGKRWTIEDVQNAPYTVAPHDDWDGLSMGTKARTLGKSSGPALHLALEGVQTDDPFGAKDEPFDPDKYVPVTLAADEILWYPGNVLEVLTGGEIMRTPHFAKNVGDRNAILGFSTLDFWKYAKQGEKVPPLVVNDTNRQLDDVCEMAAKIEERFDYKI